MKKSNQEFNFRTRAKEKQASRDADEQALKSGVKTAGELRAENGKFAFPGAEIDWSSSKRHW